MDLVVRHLREKFFRAPISPICQIPQKFQTASFWPPLQSLKILVNVGYITILLDQKTRAERMAGLGVVAFL